MSAYGCVLTETRGIECPGAAVTGGCEPPDGGWILNWVPLEEQQVPLATEPSLSYISSALHPEMLVF